MIQERGAQNPGAPFTLNEQRIQRTGMQNIPQNYPSQIPQQFRMQQNVHTQMQQNPIQYNPSVVHNLSANEYRQITQRQQNPTIGVQATQPLSGEVQRGRGTRGRNTGRGSCVRGRQGGSQSHSHMSGHQGPDSGTQ